MSKKNKIVEGKNGLRNYSFEKVQKGKRVTHYEPGIGTYYQEWTNLFYKKKCLFCEKEFEARRVDSAFCCQSCQKASLRLRAKNFG